MKYQKSDQKKLSKMGRAILKRWKALPEQQKTALIAHLLTWTELWQVTYKGCISVETQLQISFSKAEIPYDGSSIEQRRASLRHAGFTTV